MSGAGEPRPGWLAPEVAQELPGLRLLEADVEVRREGSLTGPSPADVEQRMREMSNRFRGARAIAIRREPVAAAYRVFFRQIGLDPDVVRTPIEAAVLERMVRGGFPTSGLLADVLLMALTDTSVPVWALDAARLEGGLGVRASREAEALGPAAGAPEQPAGRLLVADGRGPVAVLFGELAPGLQADAGTRRLRLFTIQVDGVPTLYAEEAMWTVRAALELL